MREMRTTALAISILAGILVLSAIVMFAGDGGSATVTEVKSESNSKTLSSHAPIYINGNSNFTSANGVTTGSGTQTDPYIMENWDINASEANGIDVRNTNVYFVIRNCVIHDGKSNDNDGIYFYNVQNGKIDNVTSYNNYCGIKLDYSSSNNTITNCAVYNNSDDGIELYGYYGACNYNQITNCAVYNNYGYGIFLHSSSNNNIIGNTFTNDGIHIWGDTLESYMHSIDTSNMVNGKPLYYFKNQNNVVVDGIVVGQLILANCTNSDINNITITSTDVGIHLAYSSNNNITNCAVYNNSWVGIWLDYSSSNNIITNCTVYNNSYYGIHLWASSDNNVTNCAVYNNSWGLSLRSSSDNNIILNCDVYNNDYGISLSSFSIYRTCDYNQISNCGVYNNSDYGIYLWHSSNNQITHCDITENTNYGIYICYNVYNPSNYNIIHHNNFINNGQNAYDPHTNYWDDGTREGNYWNDYGGTDTNSDWIGDTTYSVSDNNNQDNYPLMYSYPVGNLNKPKAYSSTLDAIDDADVGDTIYVWDGIYYENIVINKTLSLVGRNRNTTIIDGRGTSDVVYISADWVNLSELGVTNGGAMLGDAGIKIISSNNALIRNCICYNNTLTGISLYHYSTNCTVINCDIYNNAVGIFIEYCSNNSIITECRICDNSQSGIALGEVGNTTVTNCSIHNNSKGIYFGVAYNNQITYCNIQNNREYGIYIWSYLPSLYNCIHHNNFIDNNNQSYDPFTNVWDNGYPSGGNYWSDYTGTDADGDGIGDTPYSIMGGANKDNYPFMNPTERFPPTVVSTSPSSEAVNVEVDITIQITFNEPINKLTVPRNITIEPYVGIQSYSWSNGNKTVTLTLLSNLSYYTNYTVTLNTNIKDLSGNILGNIYQFSFKTKDIIPPEIANVQVTPETQEIYGYVNIIAFISDNTMLNMVYVNITYPNGTAKGNFLMTGINLDANKNGTYYYNTTYSILGTYSYCIWANDTSGNGNKSVLHYFTILDTTKPEITNVQAYPNVQTQDGWMNIICTVTDNFAVDLVNINISGPTGFTPINVTMPKILGTNNHYYNSTYSIAGKYFYYIWVNDTSGNENKSGECYFTITLAVATKIDGKEVNITGFGTGTINVTSVAAPPTPPENVDSIGIFIEVNVTGALEYANITIKYNDSDIADIDESKLRMYYWDGSQWQLCNNTGVDTDNNLVWANVTHLTIFAPMAEKALGAQPVNWLIYLGIVVTAIIILVIVAVLRKKKGAQS